MQDAVAEERDRLKATTADLESRNALFQADLELARQLQEAFVPRDYPIFPGYGASGESLLSFAHCYRPSDAVGGDFFDIFRFLRLGLASSSATSRGKACAGR
jgi:serine phosphatase RsbU (regulator of sigma subunit)